MSRYNKKMIQKEQGITLVALIVTIIVLLILAGITIATLTGESGLATKAEKADNETRKTGYEEEIKIIGNGVKIDKEIEGWDEKTYIDEYEKEIRNDEQFKEAQVTRKDDTTIEIVTKEGDVFVIEGEKVEYKGTQGEDVPPNLQEGDIEFSANPSKWTNADVTVKIAKKVEGYILQYSLDGTAWNDYKEEGITVTENTAIYARLINNIGETGGTATGNIENIDKLEPNTFTPTATSTTNSITLTGNTTDQAKTDTNGSSGIAKYYFSMDNGETWEPGEGQTGTSYTFNNLTQTKDYSLKMKAVDNAGNEIITETLTKGTGTVTGLTNSNVTFTNTPSTWTKGNVSVTIDTTVEGYTLQYSTDGTNWSDYTEALTYEQNGAIYVRLKDSTGQVGGTATGNVANIDKLVPNTFTPTATSTTNSITLTGTATDQARTATNGSSGIAKYYFSNNNGSTWVPTNGQTGTSYTFSNLTQNKAYSLKMKAVDNAGNEIITSTVSKNTGAVPGLTSSNITFTNNPSAWTNGNVSVTISTTVTGYTLQYSTDNKTWNDYKTALTFTQNGAVYARLKDSTGQVGGTATGNVTNIEKVAPTVTIGTNGGTYTIASGSTTASVTTKLTAADTGGSGLQTLQYQFSTSTSVPSVGDSKWKTFTNGANVTENLSGGTHYLYTKVIDKAGNRATSIQKSNAYNVNYQITYNANGGTGAPSAQTKTHGTNLTLSTTKPTKTNYTFAGWATSSSGSVAYQAGGTYSSNSAVTLYAKWTAAPKISITKQPTAVTVVAGNKASFTTTATGAGTITYQWYYRTSSTGAGTAISGATSSTYTLTTSTGWNGRYIYCIATATVDSTKATATTNSVLLTVQAANYSTVKSGVTTYYNTLANAHAGAVSGATATAGGTITVLQNVTDSSSVTINKTLTLNMNGKTITRSASIGTGTSANLTITGSGGITSSVRVIEAEGGTITISGPTLSATASAAVTTGTGTIRLNSGSILAKTNAVIVRGTFAMTGGTVGKTSGSTTTNQLVYLYSGAFTMSAGTISSSSSRGVEMNGGTVTITGGTITSAGTDEYGILINGGTCTVGSNSSALSTTNPNITSSKGWGVYNRGGTFNFYNGILYGTKDAYAGTINGKRSNAALKTDTSGSFKRAYYVVPTVSFTKEPQILPKLVGETKKAATYTVYATGNGTLSYQWYSITGFESGDQALMGGPIPGATSATYTTPYISTSTKVKYRCVVTCTIGGLKATIDKEFIL